MTDDASLWQTGNAHAATANWEAAAACFQSLARRRPADAGAWIALAKAWSLAGRHRGSREAALHALAAPPQQWSHGLALARLLRGHHEVRALRSLDALMSPWVAQAPVAEVLELADLLARAGAHERALARLDQVLAREPGHAGALDQRGASHQCLGRLDEAVQDLEQAIALAPDSFLAHARLTELRAQRPGQGRTRLRRLRTQRERVPAGSEADIHYSFALHAELHELGEHDEAWQALQRGCKAKRASLRYDAAAAHRLFEAVQAAGDGGFVAGDGHDGDGEPVPVFIIGQHRAGAGALARLLDAHSPLADGGESLAFIAQLRLATDYRGRDLLDESLLRRSAGLDFRALGAAFMAATSWRAGGRPAWIERLPSNFMLLGLVARALPRARFVHVQRPALDVCFANLRVLHGGQCAYSYDQGELAAHYLDYRRLMAHWQQVLGDRMIAVAQADLLREPGREIRRVLAHCRLPPDPSAPEPARPSRAKPGAPAWTPYLAQLQPLAAALAEGGAA